MALHAAHDTLRRQRFQAHEFCDRTVVGPVSLGQGAQELHPHQMYLRVGPDAAHSQVFFDTVIVGNFDE